MTPEVVVRTENLTKRYGRLVAVDCLNLEVYRGEIFGFLGPNGAGKTTTLLMLLGLTEPSEGRVWVLGQDPTRNPIEVKRRVGYLPENVGFYDYLTAEENLRFVAQLNGLSRKEADEAIAEALEVVGLSDVRDKPVGYFSRGMRQRLGIAEILVKKPEIAYLDEPTLGLDPEATQRMLLTISDLSQRHKMTIILSSHLLDQVQKVCTRVGIMFEGRLIGIGSIDDLAKKLGYDVKELNLELIYMKFFKKKGYVDDTQKRIGG